MNQRLLVNHEKVHDFCRKWKVQELAAFGSAIRDDFSPASDVDLLVQLLPGDNLNLFDWVEMREELQVIFGRKIDLVEKDAIRNPYRRQSILSSYEVLYAA